MEFILKHVIAVAALAYGGLMVEGLQVQGKHNAHIQGIKPLSTRNPLHKVKRPRISPTGHKRKLLQLENKKPSDVVYDMFHEKKSGRSQDDVFNGLKWALRNDPISRNRLAEQLIHKDKTIILTPEEKKQAHADIDAIVREEVARRRREGSEFSLVDVEDLGDKISNGLLYRWYNRSLNLHTDELMNKIQRAAQE